MAAKGMGGKTLSACTGISRETISAVLNKRVRPTMLTRETIAFALGVTVKHLWPKLEE